MNVVVVSRRRGRASIEREFPDAIVVDVTSKGESPWNQFSPFYPHGGIPVPFSPGVCSQSVEGIWQGLKVFEGSGIDVRKFDNARQSGLKRTVRRHGPVRGHQRGVDSSELLTYVEARKAIYVPTYEWVLEHRLTHLLAELGKLARGKTLVLLDYETNGDIENVARPLSHASLIRRYLMDGPTSADA